MGDNVRPVEPGSKHQPEPAELEIIMFDPFSAEDDIDESPPKLVFTAGGDPLIGTLPEGFTPWVLDDEPAA